MGNVVTLKSPDLWSINRVADFCEVHWNTAKAALKSLAPDGYDRGHAQWRSARAVQHVFAHVAAASGAVAHPDTNPQGLDDFAPKDRKDWVQSELALNKLRQEAGKLCQVEDVREQMARIVKPIDTLLDTLADVLEREAGLTPEQVEAVVASCDRARARLYESVSAGE